MKRILKAWFDTGLGVCAPLMCRTKRRLVLLYHDLHEPNQAGAALPVNLGMSVSIRHFEQQLVWLSSFADIVSLDELVAGAAQPPERWQVAITFDDAYRSVFDLGLPILERYSMPATVFVPAWYVEDNRRLPWWELLDLALQRFPDVVSLSVAGHVYRFDLGKASGQLAFREQVEKLCYFASRDQLLEIQSGLMETLSREVALPLNSFVSPRELAAGVQSPLMTVASHGSCHYNAAQDTMEHFHDDVKTSLDRIREWTGQDAHHYSYPYGKGAFRSQETTSVLAEFDLHGAYTNDPGYLTSATHHLLIPRLSVLGQWSLRTFRSRLAAINLRNRLKPPTSPDPVPAAQAQAEGAG